jgi:transcriptional regulator with XRE-family HTH domain
MATPLTLGQALRSRRDELGRSQDEVATELGTTQGNLSRWERDLTEPREIDSYRVVARFLDVDLATLAILIAESARQRVLKELSLLQDP